MKRRDLLKSGLASGAALALPVSMPATLAAQPMAGSPRDRKLFDIAKRELDKAGNAIWKRDIVGIADYGVHSAQRRFHFVNMERQEVTSYRVSHGSGSDRNHDGWLDNYSNIEGSNATSRGAYVTWEWYTGKYGTSVRLGGLDATNNNALRRYIVMHTAKYAEPSHVERWGRMGRSNGCFVLGREDFRTALLQLSGGRLIYAESLGLADDGSAVRKPAPPQPNLKPLTPENPNTMQRTNPGVF